MNLWFSFVPWSTVSPATLRWRGRSAASSGCQLFRANRDASVTWSPLGDDLAQYNCVLQNGECYRCIILRKYVAKRRKVQGGSPAQVRTLSARCTRRPTSCGDVLHPGSACSKLKRTCFKLGRTTPALQNANGGSRNHIGLAPSCHGPGCTGGQAVGEACSTVAVNAPDVAVEPTAR